MTSDELRSLLPKDPLVNARLRQLILKRCQTDPLFRRGILDACKADILFFINLFVIQVDPKQKGDKGKPSPFITYEFQDRALPKMLSWVTKGKDGLIEKSRQMGASWMLIMLFTWLWLFHPWQTFLFISRNESAVENEDPNSLFWKLDFILRHLPVWMKPKKFRRRKRFFGNDDLNSFIFGEASTGSANVGGNTTAMGIDEFSQIKEGYEVLHRTSDSTQCRIFNSTHLGLDTAFYELTRRVDLDKLVLHWSEHPIYSAGSYRAEGNRIVPLDPTYEYPHDYQFVRDGTPTGGPYPGLRSPWYDDQCKRKGSGRAIAMDLDINPSGSVEQVFDALLIRELQETYCRKPFFSGTLDHDLDLARSKGFRETVNGPLSLWFHLDVQHPPKSRYVIAGDIATGQGASPSVLSILDCTIGEKVGEYVSNEIDPIAFATLAVSLCWEFKDREGQSAKLGWEANGGTGLAFGRRVLALGFRNVYYRDGSESANPQPTDIPGWISTPKAKQALIEEYKTALQTRRFLNPSWEALTECLAFKYNASGFIEHTAEISKNSPADARQNHGDRVIADALAWRVARGQTGTRRPEELPSVPHPGSFSGRKAIYEQERQSEEVWS